jgi:aryl-alcohol dehydrogenase-like predicted oxidoreductase
LLDGTTQPHYEILARLQEEGKIRAYGASLDTYAEMERFLSTTDGTVIEAFFNILHQDTARAFATARDQGVAIIAKIPLDSGWLTGKYHASSTFQGVRSRWSAEDISLRAALVERVKEILGAPPALSQRALAFCLAFPGVSTVIPGSSSIAQLRDNLRSVEEPLPAALVARLVDFYEKEVRPLELPW